MWISCWSCGQDVWLETQKQCRHCDAPVHRCVDCEYYDAVGPLCTALNLDLDGDEAEQPTRLSLSFNCAQFRMTEEAAQRTGRAVLKSPPAGAAAPTAASRPPAAPPQRAAAAPAAAAAPGDFITIRREPPVKRPPLPLVIAHRGDSSSAPENTITAFKAALAAGAHAVEYDVHLTRDSHAVVIHDATVDRCTNGKGPVGSMTLAEIRELDAGSWFAGPFEGEQVPTLDEAIEALPGPTVQIIHLRDHENESDRCERAIAEAIERHNCRKRVAITHHTRHGLQRLRELDPLLRLCWIPYGGQPGEEYVDDAYYLGCRVIQPRISEVDEHLVKYAHDKEMWVSVFWADEIADMERMIGLGVDAIITNYPRRLKDTLKAFA